MIDLTTWTPIICENNYENIECFIDVAFFKKYSETPQFHNDLVEVMIDLKPLLEDEFKIYCKL